MLATPSRMSKDSLHHWSMKDLGSCFTFSHQTTLWMWSFPVGLMTKQGEQSSTTSPNTFSECGAAFVSKELSEVSFLLINLIMMVMCHSARLKSHLGKGISTNLQQNEYQSPKGFLLSKSNKGYR